VIIRWLFIKLKKAYDSARRKVLYNNVIVVDSHEIRQAD
jgi:hypothetical protein